VRETGQYVDFIYLISGKFSQRDKGILTDWWINGLSSEEIVLLYGVGRARIQYIARERREQLRELLSGDLGSVKLEKERKSYLKQVWRGLVREQLLNPV
jgi:hypothetical protein